MSAGEHWVACPECLSPLSVDVRRRAAIRCPVHDDLPAMIMNKEILAVVGPSVMRRSFDPSEILALVVADDEAANYAKE